MKSARDDLADCRLGVVAVTFGLLPRMVRTVCFFLVRLIDLLGFGALFGMIGSLEYPSEDCNDIGRQPIPKRD
ncbi:hypothetical protein KAR91_09190 [Candidatus Pacearchaeota archaeon]|nr:hypothetical protein [Candidatus Pacearchaeota archaeon]